MLQDSQSTINIYTFFFFTSEVLSSLSPHNLNTHCFDALMKDRFMNKIKLAKFSNEFDVPQHLDLGNGSLFLLLREEGTIMLIIDWKTKKPV